MKNYKQNCNVEMRAIFARSLRLIGAIIGIFFIVHAVATSPSLAQDEAPPTYKLIWLDNIWQTDGSIRPNDINESGVMVGKAGHHSHSEIGFMFDQANGLQDLNQLGAVWIVMDDQGNTTSTTDWFALRATGINDLGEIVGTAEHVDGRDVAPRRAYVLKFPVDSPPEFTLLPAVGVDEIYGVAINTDGIVVASGGGTIVFDPIATPAYSPVVFADSGTPQAINDQGVIVTRVGALDGGGCVISPVGTDDNGSWIYDQTSSQYFDGDQLYGVNNFDVICGLRIPITSGKPSQRRDGGAIRFQFPGVPVPDDLLKIDNTNPDAYFCGINDRGDVVFGFDGIGFIAIDRGENSPESFNLDNYIDFSFNSSEEESNWLSRGIQPQAINDSGQIAIRFLGSPNGAAFLTPVAPGPGISVSLTSDPVTTELGGQATFDVVLDFKPTADVTIGISSDKTYEGTVNVASLTFTEFNWDTTQEVIVTGVDDAAIDGDIPYNVITATAVSLDAGYDSLDAADVELTNLDNEQPSTETYENNDPLEILDRRTVSSFILVPDDTTISDLTVELNISHDRHSDLTVILIAPDGTSLSLNDFNGISQTDDAFTNLTTIEGIWELEISDDRKKKSGWLHNWSITAVLD